MVLALVDMQGRLQGKRLHAPLLPRRGGRARQRGLQLPARRRRRHEHRRRLRDVALGTRLRRLRDGARLRPRCAGCRGSRAPPWCWPTWPGSTARPVVASPRQILRRQLDRLAEHGLTAYAGTELEFVRLPRLLRGGLAARLPRPDPGQPVQRRLLAARHRPGRAAAAPHPQRDGRRRADAGERQGRVQPRPARDRLPLRRGARPAPTTTSIYKNGAKEIAAQEGMAITFMAKPNEREGNSCHIHFSLRDADGALGDARRRAGAPVADRAAGARRAARHHARVQPAASRPNINSYKRYQPGSFAPTALRWGVDNRTCALRVVGHGQGMRVENRVPGGDVNPYLAIAGAGRRRRCTASRTSWSWSAECTGNAYDDPAAERVPGTLRDALALWEGSAVARDGVRRRGGGPLRQQGAGRAGRLRRRGDGLGADPWLRTPLTHVSDRGVAVRRFW